MNLFDLFVFGTGSFLLLLGFWKGLVRQLFTLAGVLGGSALALNGYRAVARWAPLGGRGAREIFGFLALLLGCVVLSWLLGHLLSRLLESLTLGWANRFAGGGLGLVKAAVISAVVALFLVHVLPKGSTLLRESVSLPYVLAVAEQGIRLAPEDVQREMGEKIGVLRIARQRP
jgi:membrane protein required for colicin V production